MTISQQIKLQIEITDGSNFNVYPDVYPLIEKNLYTYTIPHNPKNITNIAVELISGTVIIKKILIDDIELHWLDKFGVYIDSNNNRIIGNHGYMNTPGVYNFKIRYAAKAFQYMLHLVDKFTI